MSRLRFTLLAAFVLLSAYCINESVAEKNGITGQSKVGCGGGCHGVAPSSATVVKIWSDSSQLTVGKQYLFHISVINSSNQYGGCDISVDNSAKLAVNGSGSGLRTLGAELTHNTPKLGNGDSITWTFLYTATKTGTAHIYAAGNAVNHNDREDQGDLWNTTVATVKVVASSAPSIAVPTVVRDSALLGVTANKMVWVKNTGLSTLNVSRYALKSGATWWISDSTAHTVAAGDSVAVTVSFTPTSRVTYTDTLHVSSNDALSPVASIALLGTGTAAKIRIDSPLVDFGQQKLGVSRLLHTYIYDTGTGPMTISQNQLVSPSGAFTFINAVAAPVTLGKKGGKLVDSIQFMPTRVGRDTAYVKISFTETDESLAKTVVRDTSIMLIGEGINNALVAQNASNSGLVISPNPSRGVLSIFSNKDLEGASCEVLDAVGRVVALPQAHANALDVSELSCGTYFLRITSQQGTAEVRRIVIEH